MGTNGFVNRRSRVQFPPPAQKARRSVVESLKAAALGYDVPEAVVRWLREEFAPFLPGALKSARVPRLAAEALDHPAVNAWLGAAA